SPQEDERFLHEMRKAHLTTMPDWSRKGVWKAFDCIRMTLRLDWRQVAFTNLARCHEPSGPDDPLIRACQESFPLARLVDAVNARVVFLAKAGEVGRSIRIPGEEDERPLVVRYSNGWSGMRDGLPYQVWVPVQVPAIRSLLSDVCVG
ncbi:MAG TPA: hypothetical protein VNJ51_07910, partial [Candidatus Dormibacteraeota bacterium]|nr:hypothetical protein [Candidatus Dormibacteraeota bacterium]